jgi:trimethylamine--corrinoid protein Co-methyltransferase
VTTRSSSSYPTLSFLSHEDKNSIHQAVLTILSDVGMKIYHDEALALLQAAGCKSAGERGVKIPARLVQQAIESAPSNIAVYDRSGRHAMDLGGRRAYFGTGSDLIFSLDAQTMQRHPCRLEDVCRAARVVDALPNIDFIMSFAHPSDQPPELAYLMSLHAMTTHSTKPIVTTSADRQDLNEMIEIARILRNGEKALQSKPYLLHYTEPISPLKHPFESIDKLLLCAEKAIPVVYSPAPISGSTAPLTIAGHVAQGLSECFCGLVIHQLKAEGAPFIMGTGPAVLDMATMQCSYNAPEYLLAYQAIIEMSHFYDLPSWGYAGTSDSQVPDGQAAFEAGLVTFISTMTGANLNHDVGYLDFGRTGSLEMIVILDEIVDQIRRMVQGIPVNEETLALDVIGEVGSEGNFLVHDHTLKHLRSTQWRPTLTSRMDHSNWLSSGATSLLDRARKRLAEILDTHEPLAIPDGQAARIQKRIDSYSPN